MAENQMSLRQLVYISCSVAQASGDDLSTILVQSHRNNAASGLTGLVWTDGKRFLQVLEGPQTAVKMTFDRIRMDPRHRGVVVLHDRAITVRSFVHWLMALMGDNDGRIATALANAEPVIRGTFEGLIQARRAA